MWYLFSNRFCYISADNFYMLEHSTFLVSKFFWVSKIIAIITKYVACKSDLLRQGHVTLKRTFPISSNTHVRTFNFFPDSPASPDSRIRFDGFADLTGFPGFAGFDGFANSFRRVRRFLRTPTSPDSAASPDSPASPDFAKSLCRLRRLCGLCRLRRFLRLRRLRRILRNRRLRRIRELSPLSSPASPDFPASSVSPTSPDSPAFPDSPASPDSRTRFAGFAGFVIVLYCTRIISCHCTSNIWWGRCKIARDRKGPCKGHVTLTYKFTFECRVFVCYGNDFPGLENRRNKEKVERSSMHT